MQTLPSNLLNQSATRPLPYCQWTNKLDSWEEVESLCKNVIDDGKFYPLSLVNSHAIIGDLNRVYSWVRLMSDGSLFHYISTTGDDYGGRYYAYKWGHLIKDGVATRVKVKDILAKLA